MGVGVGVGVGRCCAGGFQKSGKPWAWGSSMDALSHLGLGSTGAPGPGAGCRVWVVQEEAGIGGSATGKPPSWPLGKVGLGRKCGYPRAPWAWATAGRWTGRGTQQHPRWTQLIPAHTAPWGWGTATLPKEEIMPSWGRMPGSGGSQLWAWPPCVPGTL